MSGGSNFSETASMASRFSTTVQKAWFRFILRVIVGALSAGAVVLLALPNEEWDRAALVSAGYAVLRFLLGLLTPIDPAVGVKSGEFKHR